MISDHGILYIEPSARTSDDPTIDDLTRKMAAALRQGQDGLRWRGFHICGCGVNSDNTDYTLPGGEQTNSLCVHYLAWHRHEVPTEQLDKVSELDVEPVKPTLDELANPATHKFGVR